MQCSAEVCRTPFTKSAIAERIPFVILNHAHRQIHAENAGGAAGGAGPRVATEQSEITNEHFLSALLDQSDGIARPLLEKIGANVDQLQERLRAELERRPKIHGSAADLRISNELRTVLDSAEKEMSKLKDEFTSAEHYLLALSRRRTFLRQNC